MTQALQIENVTYVLPLDGVATVPWRYMAAGHHRGEFLDADGRFIADAVLGVDFRVWPEGDTLANVGRVEMLHDLPGGYGRFRLFRNTAAVQLYAATPGAEGVEKQLDRDSLVDQEIQAALTRTLRLRDPQEKLTPLGQSLLGFDDDGNVVLYPITGTGGDGYLNVVTITITGDGERTDWPLPFAPGNIGNTRVNFGAAYQLRSTYSVTGTILHFFTPVPRGMIGEVDLIQTIEIPQVHEQNVVMTEGGTLYDQLAARPLPFASRDTFVAASPPASVGRALVNASVVEADDDGVIQTANLRRWNPAGGQFDFGLAGSASDIASDFSGIFSQFVADCSTHKWMGKLGRPEPYEGRFADLVVPGDVSLDFSGAELFGKTQFQHFAGNGVQTAFTIDAFPYLDEGVSLMAVDGAGDAVTMVAGTDYAMAGPVITPTVLLPIGTTMVVASRVPLVRLRSATRSTIRLRGGRFDLSNMGYVVAQSSGSGPNLTGWGRVYWDGAMESVNNGGRWYDPILTRRSDSGLTLTDCNSSDIFGYVATGMCDLAAYISGGADMGFADDGYGTRFHGGEALRCNLDIKSARGHGSLGIINRVGRDCKTNIFLAAVDDGSEIFPGRNLQVQNYQAKNTGRRALDDRSGIGGKVQMTIEDWGYMPDGSLFIGDDGVNDSHAVFISQKNGLDLDVQIRPGARLPAPGRPAIQISGTCHAIRIKADITGNDIGIAETGGTGANEYGNHYDLRTLDVAAPLSLASESLSTWVLDEQQSDGSGDPNFMAWQSSDGRVTPQHFGGVGNGIKDDTEAVQLAASYAAAVEGRELSLNKIYGVSGKIDMRARLGASPGRLKVLPTFGADADKCVVLDGTEAALRDGRADHALYVDGGSFFGEVRGTWSAASGAFPLYTDYKAPNTMGLNSSFKVTVAGTVGGVSFAVGDLLIALVAQPSTAVFAGNWKKVAGEISAVKVSGLALPFGNIRVSALRCDQAITVSGNTERTNFDVEGYFCHGLVNDNSVGTAPEVSGALTADITAAVGQTITLTPAGSGVYYSIASNATIDAEIVAYTRVGDVLTLTARGLVGGTAAAAHLAGALVTQPDDVASPDNNSFRIRGASCGQWYRSSGTVVSDVDFQVQNQCMYYEKASVEITATRMVSLQGALRTSRYGCILVAQDGNKRNTGVNFVGLKVVNPIVYNRDWLIVEDTGMLTGFVIVLAPRGGAWIKKCDGADLVIIQESLKVDATILKLGSTAETKTATRSDIKLNATRHETTNSVMLDVQSASRSVIDVVGAPLPVIISSAPQCQINLPAQYIAGNISCLLGSTGLVRFIGGATLLQFQNYSTPARGMSGMLSDGLQTEIIYINRGAGWCSPMFAPASIAGKVAVFGQATLSGAGAALVVNVAHGGVSFTPTSVFLTPRNADARTALASGFYVDDMTNVHFRLNFTTAPAGTNNLVFDFIAYN
ncbi:MAG: hypothetical protein V4712_17750 [Pseudomonadota bacterium]